MKHLLIAFIALFTAPWAYSDTIYADSLAHAASSFTLVPGDTNPPVNVASAADNAPIQNVFSLNNMVAYKDLGKTIQGDFTLTVKVNGSTNLTSHYIGLFNAAGTQGYVAAFAPQNQAAPSPPSTAVGISTFNISPKDLATNMPTYPNGPYNASNADASYGGSLVFHKPVATTHHFAQLSLSYVASSGTLTLSLDGSPMVTKIDKSFSSFSRVYIEGSAGGEFYDLKITSSALAEAAAHP